MEISASMVHLHHGTLPVTLITFKRWTLADLRDPDLFSFSGTKLATSELSEKSE